MLQSKRLSGPDRTLKLDVVHFPPPGHPYTGTLERVQRRIQQHNPRQHRLSRKVSRVRRVIGCYWQWRADHVRFIELAASDRRDSCGSLPVSLRGRASTNSSGRGRNTGSIRLRSCSVTAAASRAGATTSAATRVTPVEALSSSARTK